MQTKVITICVLGIGATALGGVLLLGNRPKKPKQTDAALYASSSRGTGSVDPYAALEMPALQAEPTRRLPGQAGAQGNRDGFDWADFASRMSQFDADGDGVLSEEERDAMRKAMRVEWEARMDLNGDGEISREERMAAMKERFEQSQRGQELMRRFDADGDGKLSEEEQAVMDDYLQQERDARRQEQIDRYDTDGDGELSRDERQAQRQEQRDRRENFMDEMNAEFDHDGDGQLNIEEQLDAMNTMRERREIDRFLNQFDSDGDGRMSPADYDSFANDYGNGDMGADVNRDGVVDSQDLTAYRDLVTRSQNRP